MGADPSVAECFILDLVERGMFSIDDEGRIWRHAVFTRGGRLRWVSPRRAEQVQRDGYASVRVAREGREYRALAHRLVWLALRGPIPAGEEINHKDGQRACNHPDNLEPLTPSRNSQHAYDVLGRAPTIGERNGRARLTAAQVQEIRSRPESSRALGREFGVSKTMILHIKVGRRWREFPDD